VTWTDVASQPFCAFDEVSDMVIPHPVAAKAWRIVAASNVVPGPVNRWSVYELAFLARAAAH